MCCAPSALPDELAHGSIRFGIGRFNTVEEIDFTIAEVTQRSATFTKHQSIQLPISRGAKNRVGSLARANLISRRRFDHVHRTLTEKAAGEVKRIISEQQASRRRPRENLSAHARRRRRLQRLFQHKLDLDPQVNEKLDEVSEIHGVPVAIDKRSLMYLDGVNVDFHDDLNRRGFSITQPQRQDHLRLRQLVLDVKAKVRALSSVARAPGLHPGGRGFETLSAHKYNRFAKRILGVRYPASDRPWLNMTN